MRAVLLLLAAGAARRMRGSDKLLERVDGDPIIVTLAKRGVAAGLDVRVTVPDLAHPRAQALADLPVTCVAVDDWHTGMSASLRRGVAGLDGCDVLILPADMPEITTEDLRKVAACPGQIVRATSSDGAHGHPVKFAAALIPHVSDLRGDQGARSVLTAHAEDVVTCALPGNHATTDLDTPEDWAQWRERR